MGSGQTLSSRPREATDENKPRIEGLIGIPFISSTWTVRQLTPQRTIAVPKDLVDLPAVTEITNLYNIHKRMAEWLGTVGDLVSSVSFFFVSEAGCGEGGAPISRYHNFGKHRHRSLTSDGTR